MPFLCHSKALELRLPTVRRVVALLRPFHAPLPVSGNAGDLPYRLQRKGRSPPSTPLPQGPEAREFRARSSWPQIHKFGCSRSRPYLCKTIIRVPSDLPQLVDLNTSISLGVLYLGVLAYFLDILSQIVPSSTRQRVPVLAGLRSVRIPPRRRNRRVLTSLFHLLLRALG